MRHPVLRLSFVSLLLLLVLSAMANAQSPPQTRRWRIGVAGGYCTGYLGMLALHGLPR
jgi:hypothetical protein